MEEKVGRREEEGREVSTAVFCYSIVADLGFEGGGRGYLHV